VAAQEDTALDRKLLREEREIAPEEREAAAKEAMLDCALVREEKEIEKEITREREASNALYMRRRR
jgi:hypothetical protein